MQQRVRQPYRGINPSSARQLPILAALHAGFPTLFGCIIHEKEEKVNTQFANIGIFLSIDSMCGAPGRRNGFPRGEAVERSETDEECGQ